MSLDVAMLTAVEATALDDLEGIVEKGLATFVEVGNALRRIRDQRLYRELHSTFDDYCKERWGISRFYAHRQIEAANVAGALLPNGNTPTTESVARELAPLKDQPEKLQEAWSETVEQHGPKPTAKQVKEVVRGKAEPTKAKPARPQNRKPSKAHKEEVGRQQATAITGALDVIGCCTRPEGPFGWALDVLGEEPGHDWRTFVERIEEAQEELKRLLAAAEERNEATWSFDHATARPGRAVI